MKDKLIPKYNLGDTVYKLIKKDGRVIKSVIAGVRIESNKIIYMLNYFDEYPTLNYIDDYEFELFDSEYEATHYYLIKNLQRLKIQRDFISNEMYKLEQSIANLQIKDS